MYLQRWLVILSVGKRFTQNRTVINEHTRRCGMMKIIKKKKYKTHIIQNINIFLSSILPIIKTYLFYFSFNFRYQSAIVVILLIIYTVPERAIKRPPHCNISTPAHYIITTSLTFFHELHSSVLREY